MEYDDARLSERIACAEDWLARARRQLEQGETARGSLALLLAEAEVHRARELGMKTERARPSLRPAHAALGGLTIAALAAGLWASGLQPAAIPRPAADARPAMIVTLSGGHGSLLELVRAPAAADPKSDEDRGHPVRPKALRPPVETVAPRPAPPVPVPQSPIAALRPQVKPEAVPAPVAAPPAPFAPPASAEAPAPAPVVQPSAPPVVSEANLIDLVLAAERSLRRANQ
jgi:hypothetical protein